MRDAIYCNGSLLAAVQNARIFEDCKTFVDMALRYDAGECEKQSLRSRWYVACISLRRVQQPQTLATQIRRFFTALVAQMKI